ncbi:hypothetical protein FQA39_LY12228 [Lamprigera yunnana]|nr:hypothetical protein FQA39_LY12228 [Lamprigera yunnana]
MLVFKQKQRQSPETHSLHRCMCATVIIGQVFALMPVDGVTKIFFLATVIFFGNSIGVHILFMQLARAWPKLMQIWRSIEVSMKSYGFPLKMNFRIKLTTVVVLTTATVEHLLSVINHFIESDDKRSESKDIFEYFFVTIAFPQLFSMLKYSIWLGCFMQVITFVSTFSWTYIDLFIMLMSTSLALRFRQVADRVDKYSEENVSNEDLWKILREDYSRLSQLCKNLNDCLSNFVILSFASNIFFILVQLFHTLKGIEDPLGKVYFYFSFGFLLARTVCVCLYGAWINDESKRPLLTLSTVSSNIYNIEVRSSPVKSKFSFRPKIKKSSTGTSCAKSKMRNDPVHQFALKEEDMYWRDDNRPRIQVPSKNHLKRSDFRTQLRNSPRFIYAQEKEENEESKEDFEHEFLKRELEKLEDLERKLRKKKSLDNSENLKQLSSFRNKNYFDCHSVGDSSNIVEKHQCVFRFKINNRLIPEPLHSDKFGTSRCIYCDKPMKNECDEEKDTLRMTELHRAKRNNAIIHRINIGNKDITELEISKDYDKLLKLFENTVGNFKQVCPVNSIALRHQKGVKLN